MNTKDLLHELRVCIETIEHPRDNISSSEALSLVQQVRRQCTDQYRAPVVISIDLSDGRLAINVNRPDNRRTLGPVPLPPHVAIQFTDYDFGDCFDKATDNYCGDVESNGAESWVWDGGEIVK